jgi:Transcriptional regulator
MSSNQNSTRQHILETTWKLLESNPGQSPSMSKIAKASELSRQALYLHFASRTELLVATTRYVDEVKGLDKRLAKLQTSESAEQKLVDFVELWGDYIPEIYGVSKALMISKETDQDAAAAWDEIMGCLHQICLEITQKLSDKKALCGDWTAEKAADFLWTLMSIQTWEQLTLTCKWRNEEYVHHMKMAANRLIAC